MNHFVTPSVRYKTLSLRLPLWMLDEIQEFASFAGVLYRVVINIFLAERVREELSGKRNRAVA